MAETRRSPALLMVLNLAAGAAALAGPASWGAIPAGAALSGTLRQEIISHRKSQPFTALLKLWEGRDGTQAVEPLVKLAHDRTLEDPERYVALMGAAKLGGKAVAPLLSDLLEDRSWMIRSGALRAIGALGDATLLRRALPLLRDPALVVRLEAVEALSRLRPQASEMDQALLSDALIAAAADPANFRAGKPLWVPEKALNALAGYRGSMVAVNEASLRKLAPLLTRPSADHRLRDRVVDALNAVSGRKLGLAQWKQELAGS